MLLLIIVLYTVVVLCFGLQDIYLALRQLMQLFLLLFPSLWLCQKELQPVPGPLASLKHFGKTLALFIKGMVSSYHKSNYSLCSPS